MAAPTTRAKLLRAKRAGRFVRFTRPFESGRVHGYVLAVGSRFFLLADVSSHLWYNGFEVLRIQDVRALEADPFARFAEHALRKRGQRRPRTPKVDVATIADILRSAARAFPLVTIHREKIDPDVCEIGRVVDVERDGLRLLAIGPDAKWESEPAFFKLDDITRVSFGGDYEDALYEVGGEPRER